MAKKSTRTATAASPVKLTDKDKKTIGSLRELAGAVATHAERSRAPEAYADASAAGGRSARFIR